MLAGLFGDRGDPGDGVDMSTLTGQSVPVTRSAGPADTGVPLLQARNVVFSGTACTGGQAAALVTATGMRTELGAGIAFLPIGLAAGLTVASAASFAIGLLVANVPEGLLPTITLALARDGSPRGPGQAAACGRDARLYRCHVICSDNTGTLTENRVCVTTVWTPERETALAPPGSASPEAGTHPAPGVRAALGSLARIAAACNNADLHGTAGIPAGEPTELALLELAGSSAVDISLASRGKRRHQRFRFDSRLKLMTTVDKLDVGLIIGAKGAPEVVLARCTTIRRSQQEQSITGADRPRPRAS